MQNNRVVAKIVDDLFSPDNDGVAGRIKYYRSNTPGADELAGANFWCPCGCGYHGWLTNGVFERC